MEGKKVLIVDDDTDILEVLNLLFEFSGYQTKATPDAGDTCKLVEEFQPNAIVMDVLLSGYDGREICRRLKAADHTSNIPIVMISAHPDAAKSTREAGADDFVAKPFDIHVLLEKVEKLLPEVR